MTKQGDSGEKKNPKLLAPDSGLMHFMTKTGQVIMLNIIWLLSCLPVFTIGTATTSLYYAMMKNIRRNRSYPVVEYWASFKRTFVTGSIFTLGAGIWLFLLWHLRAVALSQETGGGLLLSRIYIALMLVTVAILIYLFPVLSRFTMKRSMMLRLAFVMAVRYLGFTLVMLAGTILLAWAWFFYLPMPLVLVWPGVWCYLCTFMIEKALRKYMPAPDPEGNEDAWYFE